MRILIAPNAFKDSLDATQAADAIATGLVCSTLAHTTRCLPVGDGGDGTAELIRRHLRGDLIDVEVQDPLGRPVSAHFGRIYSGRTALIGVAEASGLRLLTAAERDPLRASSYGTGQLIAGALEHGTREIVLGAGGSATVNGGCGILLALGARLLDQAGEPLRNLPADLIRLHSIDLSGLDPRLQASTVTILCDVGNPLLGPNGAARVFGPQKGATPVAIETLESALSCWSRVLERTTGCEIASVARGGVAGGIGAGLMAALNARLVSGIEYFLQTVDFDTALRSADLVITGEGSIDEQTLQGKAPYGIAMRAKALGLPVMALAGQVPLKLSPGLRQCFDVLLPIGCSPGSIDAAFRSAHENLTRTACHLGNALSVGAAHTKSRVRTRGD